MKHSRDYPLEMRPVMGFSDSYPAGLVDPPHSHPRSQLTFCRSGIMMIVASDSVFMLPPNRAIWLPAGTVHEVRCRGPVSSTTLYFDPGIAQDLCQPRVTETTALVGALIDEVGRFDPDYDLSGREGSIARLLIEEIGRMAITPSGLPMPQDPRLLRVCNALLENPADDRSLDDWADVAAMGRRTFTRAFRRETGAGLATWRQQARLMAAIPKLEAGQPVTTVAFDVGYDSPSAFTATFHRVFGVSPSNFIIHQREDPPG